MADPAAGPGAGAGAGAGNSSGRRITMCRRGVVIFFVLAHLAVTWYVLDVMLESSSAAHSFRGWNSFSGSENRGPRSGYRMSEAERAQAAMEWRRKAAPLLLMLRVKDIEAEVVLDLQARAEVPRAKIITQEEEVEVQRKLESRHNM